MGLHLGRQAEAEATAGERVQVMGGAGVPIYLAGWLLIPEEGAEQSIASGFIQSMQSRSR